MDWLKTLTTYAPAIAGAIATGGTGPLIAVALKTVADHFGVEPTEQAVAQAVQKASPEDLLKLKQLDLEFAKLDLSRDQAYLGDVQSARLRDQAMIEKGYHNSRANTMLAGAGMLVIVILGLIVTVTPLDDFVKSTLLLILGRCLGYVDQGFAFEFGTTRASKSKDETISAMAKG